MAANVSTIEVDRPPAEVFAYVIDPTRFSEWQENVIGGHMEGNGPPAVGDKCVTARRIGFAERPATSEVTHIDPPMSWGVRGTEGPIRAIVDVTVDALAPAANRRGARIGLNSAPVSRTSM